jgi:hypothetical protein
MKRSWFTERDQASDFGEGSEAARAKAIVLAERCDAELLDSLLQIVVSLQTFGGTAFIGVERKRFNRSGQEVSHNAPGQYVTTAYVHNYDHQPMKGVPEEPDLNLQEAVALYRSEILQPVTDPEANGAPEPVGAAEGPDADRD